MENCTRSRLPGRAGRASTPARSWDILWPATLVGGLERSQDLKLSVIADPGSRHLPYAQLSSPGATKSAQSPNPAPAPNVVHATTGRSPRAALWLWRPARGCLRGRPASRFRPSPSRSTAASRWRSRSTVTARTRSRARPSTAARPAAPGPRPASCWGSPAVSRRRPGRVRRRDADRRHALGRQRQPEPDQPGELGQPDVRVFP